MLGLSDSVTGMPHNQECDDYVENVKVIKKEGKANTSNENFCITNEILKEFETKIGKVEHKLI